MFFLFNVLFWDTFVCHLNAEENENYKQTLDWNFFVKYTECSNQNTNTFVMQLNFNRHSCSCIFWVFFALFNFIFIFYALYVYIYSTVWMKNVDFLSFRCFYFVSTISHSMCLSEVAQHELSSIIPYRTFQ